MMTEQGIVYKYSRISSEVSFFSFFKTSFIWFYPRSLVYQSQVLGNPSNVKYEFYLVEWTLNQINYCLITPMGFVPPLP